MNVYSITPEADGFSSKDMQELSSELVRLGFSYQQGQFGGGPGEIPKQIIAWLSVNSDWISSITNLTILIGVAGKWYKKHKKSEQKQELPVINISIYNNAYKSSIEIDVSRHYSTSEIKEIIDKLDIK